MTFQTQSRRIGSKRIHALAIQFERIHKRIGECTNTTNNNNKKHDKKK